MEPHTTMKIHRDIKISCQAKIFVSNEQLAGKCGGKNKQTKKNQNYILICSGVLLCNLMAFG